MKKRTTIVALLFLFTTTTIKAQTDLQTQCQVLVSTAYDGAVERGRIDVELEKLFDIMHVSTFEELMMCNCADSLWIRDRKDQRKIQRFATHIYTDGTFLRMLSSRVDIEYLNQLLRLTGLNTLNDSLQFIIGRLDYKAKRRKDGINNFYHCVEAEAGFIKRFKYELLDEFSFLINGDLISEDQEDVIFLAMFNSKMAIEDWIFNNVDTNKIDAHKHRIMGVLRTSGGDRSAKYLLKKLHSENDLKEIKIILLAIYGIMDRETTKKRTNRKILTYLRETKLDTLTRYELLKR